jgi:hypothetical protein
VDVVDWQWFKWFWGLTCDFWAKNAEKKCNQQNNIRFGDDSKEGERRNSSGESC